MFLRDVVCILSVAKHEKCCKQFQKIKMLPKKKESIILFVFNCFNQSGRNILVVVIIRTEQIDVIA